MISARFSFTRSEVTQLVPIVICSVLSILAILFLAGRIAWVSSFAKQVRYSVARESIFFRTQLGLFASCLLLSNAISCVGGIMVLAWVVRSGIYEGTLCTAQATLFGIGDFGSAYFTATVAVHTFNSLVMRNKTPSWVAALIAAFGWAASLCVGIVPAFITGSRGPIYGDVTYVCGITKSYPLVQFLVHILPIFVTTVLAAVLYSLIFFCLRGNLAIRGGLRFSLDPHDRWSRRIGDFDEYYRFLGAIAKSMLWYPLAYLFLMIPISFTLLLSISGFSVAWSGMVMGTACSLLLGLANVLLIYNTLRVLRPALDASAASDNAGSDAEKSFFSSGTVPAVAPLPPVPVAVSGERRSGSVGSLNLAIATATRRSSGVVPYRNVSPTSDDGSVYSLIRPSRHSPHGSDATAYARPITPPAQLSLEIGVPELSLSIGTSPAPIQRTLSSETISAYSISSGSSSLGLPPPPRMSRSPIQRHPSVVNTIDARAGQHQSVQPSLSFIVPSNPASLEEALPINTPASVTAFAPPSPPFPFRMGKTSSQAVSSLAPSTSSVHVGPSEYGTTPSSPFLAGKMRELSAMMAASPAPRSILANGAQGQGAAAATNTVAWASNVTRAATAGGSYKFGRQQQQQQQCKGGESERRDVPAALKPRTGR